MYKNLTGTQIALIVVVIIIVLYLLFGWNNDSYEGLTNVTAPNSALYAGTPAGSNTNSCSNVAVKNRLKALQARRAQLQAKANANSQANTQAIANLNAQIAAVPVYNQATLNQMASNQNAQAVANLNAQMAMNQNVSATSSPMANASSRASWVNSVANKHPKLASAWNRFQQNQVDPQQLQSQSQLQYQQSQPLQPQENYRLYNFYTNWCGYSRSFMPVWKQIETYYDNSPVSVYTLDADDAANKQLASKWNIDGYPTVILETPNGITKYSGPRDLQSITNFVNQMISKRNQ
jgi:thiol-disulfide isomerase/thioredoxin